MEHRPKILAVSGVKNSGKTTFIERLLPRLAEFGIKTAVIKHDGHFFNPDTPGTDSYRFFAAGALGAAVYDYDKFSLTRRDEISERELIGFFPDADLILLEGFKGSDYPKIELIRSEVSLQPVCDPETCLAIITDLNIKTELPVFHPDAVEDIAGFIYSIISR